MRRQPLRDERGQASPEWLGVVGVACIAFAAMVAAGVRVPRTGLADALVERFACAVSLGEGCGGEPSDLTLAYGPGMAGLVAELVPTLEYEEGMLALPVDWRSCRGDACANGPDSGEATETQRGEPVTLFSHVVNCLDPEAPMPLEAKCEGGATGNLYIQFWAYYPDSATTPFDGEAFGRAGYHPDDWESFQVRIGPDGIEERASSHHGYNGEGGDPVNDTGWLPGKPGLDDRLGAVLDLVQEPRGTRGHLARVPTPVDTARERAGDPARDDAGPMGRLCRLEKAPTRLAQRRLPRP